MKGYYPPPGSMVTIWDCTHCGCSGILTTWNKKDGRPEVLTCPDCSKTSNPGEVQCASLDRIRPELDKQLDDQIRRTSSRP